MGVAHEPVILTYHSIAGGGSPIEIPPEMFAQQMDWLAGHFRVAPLAEVVDALRAHHPLPERTVVLTFDDGFADFFSVAAPVLLRHRLPATVFLPTAYLGKTSAWPGQPAWVKTAPLLSWEQVRELSAAGIDFGAHSVSHPALTALGPADVEKELAESREEIETHTGRPAAFFCYPYGLWNPAVRRCAQQHFRGACSTAAGAVEPDADPYALPRVDAHYLRNRRWFRSLFTQRFRSYVAARRIIRRIRGQPEGSYARV